MKGYFEAGCLIGYGLAALWGLGGLYAPRAFRRVYGHAQLALGMLFLTAWIAAEGGGLVSPGTRAQTLQVFVWFATVIYGFIQWRFRVASLLAYVGPFSFIVLSGAAASGGAGRALSPEAANTLVRVHIWTVLAAYAGFTLTFLASVMYLVQHRRLSRRRPTLDGGDTVSLEVLEKTAYVSLAWAFPLLSLALLLGVVGQAVTPVLGAAWFRDPKVVGGAVIWVIYGLLLNARLAALLLGYRFARASAWAFSLFLFIFLSTSYLCGAGVHKDLLGGLR